MLELDRRDLEPGIREMFSLGDPAAMRLFGVLEYILPGRIVVDRLIDPNWVVAQEKIFGSIYLGGEISPNILTELMC